MIGRFLKHFPSFRKRLLYVYSYLNYVLFSDRKIEVTHPNIQRKFFDEKNEHFFGYYDKTPWSLDQEQILYHRVNDNKIDLDIIVYDLKSDKPTYLATTKTWNWQQGAMLQWLPPDSKKIIYNNISRDKNIIAEIRNINNGDLIDTLPLPIQTLRKDGKKAISLNYRRLAVLRPDYGYRNESVNLSPELLDNEDGLFSIDMITHETKLIVSIQFLKMQKNFPQLSNPRHKVNHAMYAPSGNKLVFLHRCLHSGGKKDRFYLIDDEGNNLKLLMDDNMISHYSWIDNHRLIVFANTKLHGLGYYLVYTDSGEIIPVAKKLWHFSDGHPSMSHDEKFFVTDSYPDRIRMQHLMLFFMQDSHKEEITQLFTPLSFQGEKRCDFHPRLSPDGRFVSIDSVEQGKRIMSIFEISKLIERNNLL
jgi:hypothetical protein